MMPDGHLRHFMDGHRRPFTSEGLITKALTEFKVKIHYYAPEDTRRVEWTCNDTEA